MPPLTWLDAAPVFPPVSQALPDPDGLLAAGGDLSRARLLTAYREGLFPWCGRDEPLLWWSPSERCLIRPADFVPSRSLRQRARQSGWTVSVDRCFDQVVRACAAARESRPETWIGNDFIAGYLALHRAGHAHSIEIWHDRQLAGGLYGVSVGGVFCGESMFSHRSDASKLAFWALMTWLEDAGVDCVDCQLENPHLLSLGASLHDRDEYLAQLHAARDRIAPAWWQAERRLSALRAEDRWPLPVLAGCPDARSAA